MSLQPKPGRTPFNQITRKEGGEQDLIAFDNPDDGDVQATASASAETLVTVDNPDDFPDEGHEV